MEPVIVADYSIVVRSSLNYSLQSVIAEIVRTWLKDIHPRAIERNEQAYIDHHDDLIQIQPRVKSWFRNVLESTFLLRSPRLRPYFERRPRDETIEDGKTVWQNGERVERFSSGVIGCVDLAMLIGPLWMPQHVSLQYTQAIFLCKHKRIELRLGTGDKERNMLCQDFEPTEPP